MHGFLIDATARSGGQVHVSTCTLFTVQTCLAETVEFTARVRDDIFTADFIFVPVYTPGHFSVAVICHIGAIAPGQIVCTKWRCSLGCWPCAVALCGALQAPTRAAAVPITALDLARRLGITLHELPNLFGDCCCPTWPVRSRRNCPHSAKCTGRIVNNPSSTSFQPPIAVVHTTA